MTLVFPDVAVAPAFVHAAPMRAAPDAAFGDDVVDFDAAAHEAQSIPEVLSASPGLSACVPSPRD